MAVLALVILLVAFGRGAQPGERGSRVGSSGDLPIYSALVQASASSFWDEKSKPGNVLDQDVRTAWKPKAEHGLQRPQWLRVDLGTVHQIKAVVLDAGLGGYVEPPLLPTHFSLEISRDDQQYLKVVVRAGVVEPRLPIEFAEPLKARFIRLNILKQWRNKPCAIAELEVYSRIPPGGLMPLDAHTIEQFEPRSGQVRPIGTKPDRQVIRLDGEWEFRMDPEAVGESQRWPQGTTPFPHRIHVPGNWNAQGFGGVGDGVGLNWDGTANRSLPIRGSYYGVGWYRKRIRVPETWSEKQLVLKFAGVMPNLKLWVNGDFVGARYTSGTSVCYDVTRFTENGKENVITLSIDNRASRTAYQSHLQRYPLWGGIYDSVDLEARAPTFIDRVFIVPDLGRSGARFHVRLQNTTPEAVKGRLILQVRDPDAQGPEFKRDFTVTLTSNEGRQLDLLLDMPGANRWSPSSPFLYEAELRWHTADSVDSWTDRFGLRQICARDGRILLNGSPFLVRGMHFSYFFYDTLSPWLSIEEYRKVLEKYREYGFNYLRVPMQPPRDFFDAADEVGVLIQLALDYVSDSVYELAPSFQRLQLEGVFRQHGNHPSLVAYELSNEKMYGTPALAQLYFRAREMDPTRLIVDSDGVLGTPRPTADLWIVASNIYAVGYGVPDRSWERYMQEIAVSRVESDGKPVIDHEFLNLPTLPNLRLIDRFVGATLPPSELIEMRDWLESIGWLEKYSEFLRSSYHLQSIFFKEGIETARKNPSRSGYSACSFTDLETRARWAILDSYFGEKGITPGECRQYNDDTALLVNLPGRESAPFLPRHTYWCGESIPVEFLVSHYGSTPIKGAMLEWEIAWRGDVIRHGSVQRIGVHPGDLTSVAKVEIQGFRFSRPRKVTLQATLRSDEREINNRWDLWLFPRIAAKKLDAQILALGSTRQLLARLVTNLLPESKGQAQPDLVVTDHLDGEALAYASGGGRVLLLSLDDFPSVTTGFWPGWYRPGDRNLGARVLHHPALGIFPHEGFADWQFQALMHRAAIVSWQKTPFAVKKAAGRSYAGGDVDFSSATPLQADHIISGVINNFEPKAVTHLFELGIGPRGGMLACGFDFKPDTPESRFLLLQLLYYVLGRDFSPRSRLSQEAVTRWMKLRAPIGRSS